MDLQITLSGCLESNAAKHDLSCVVIAEVITSGAVTGVKALSLATFDQSVKLDKYSGCRPYL
jgi:hypothetical protein